MRIYFLAAQSGVRARPGRRSGARLHTPGVWPLGDIQEWIWASAAGDDRRVDRVLSRLTRGPHDGMLPEAYDPHTATWRSRRWFAWPGAVDRRPRRRRLRLSQGHLRVVAPLDLVAAGSGPVGPWLIHGDEIARPAPPDAWLRQQPRAVPTAHSSRRSPPASHGSRTATQPAATLRATSRAVPCLGVRRGLTP